MPTQIALLRGINIGSRNRIAMPALRELLGGAGYENVRTYVQSGNVVLEAKGSSQTLERKLRALIAGEFGLDIEIVARTSAELAKIVDRDPLGEMADEHKRYLVTFLSASPKAEVVKQLEELRAEPERLKVVGKEIYSWHPAGVARSKLWNKLAGRSLGVTATSRNWTTVNKLLELADA